MSARNPPTKEDKPSEDELRAWLALEPPACWAEQQVVLPLRLLACCARSGVCPVGWDLALPLILRAFDLVAASYYDPEVPDPSLSEFGGDRLRAGGKRKKSSRRSSLARAHKQQQAQNRRRRRSQFEAEEPDPDAPRSDSSTETEDIGDSSSGSEGEDGGGDPLARMAAASAAAASSASSSSGQSFSALTSLARRDDRRRLEGEDHPARRARIREALAGLPNPPFTLQRITELLLEQFPLPDSQRPLVPAWIAVRIPEPHRQQHPTAERLLHAIGKCVQGVSGRTYDMPLVAQVDEASVQGGSAGFAAELWMRGSRPSTPMLNSPDGRLGDIQDIGLVEGVSCIHPNAFKGAGINSSSGSPLGSPMGGGSPGRRGSTGGSSPPKLSGLASGPTGNSPRRLVSSPGSPISPSGSPGRRGSGSRSISQPPSGTSSGRARTAEESSANSASLAALQDYADDDDDEDEEGGQAAARQADSGEKQQQLQRQDSPDSLADDDGDVAMKSDR